MYFSQNKKPYERRTVDDFRQRASVREETAPTFSPASDTPQTPPESQSEGNFPSLAMVYSPKQAFEGLYEPEEALSRGTLFAALDLPFEGRRVTKR